MLWLWMRFFFRRRGNRNSAGFGAVCHFPKSSGITVPSSYCVDALFSQAVDAFGHLTATQQHSNISRKISKNFTCFFADFLLTFGVCEI
jgi:hypothetical protein